MSDIVLNGQLWLAIPIALAAGLLSFLSPCILPLVPGYLGFLGGTATGKANDRRRLLLSVTLFVAGFTVIFVFYSLLAGAISVWLTIYLDVILRIMGVVLVVLGLVFVGFFSALQRTVRPRIPPRAGLVGAPLLGAVFALGWTPCIGPTLSVVLSLSLVSESVPRAVLLGIAYCVGLGVPFIVLALGWGWATRSVGWLRKHIRVINIVGGLMLIVIGLAMVTGVWTTWMFELQAVIDSYVPAL